VHLKTNHLSFATWKNSSYKDAYQNYWPTLNLHSVKHGHK